MSKEPWLILSPAFSGGSAVICPNRGDEHYFTLIGAGSIKNQNKVARRIVEAANSHEDLKAEIDRLRAALECMLIDPPPTLDEPDTNFEVIQKMRAIARGALNPSAGSTSST